MSKGSSLLKEHEETMLLKEVVDRIGRDYKDVKKIYTEYQRLREKIGKPVKGYPLEPNKIKKDLSSGEFLTFLEELKEKIR